MVGVFIHQVSKTRPQKGGGDDEGGFDWGKGDTAKDELIRCIWPGFLGGPPADPLDQCKFLLFMIIAAAAIMVPTTYAAFGPHRA